MKKIIPFGAFLLEKGLITEQDLLEALTQQKKHFIPVGEIAMARGELTQKQILEILNIQQEADDHKRFCEIALMQGYLNKESVSAILGHHRLFRMHLGDLLVGLKKLRDDALRTAIFEYETLLSEECPQELEDGLSEPLRVLVVDDEELIRNGIAAILSLNDFEVETSSGAFDAINKIEEGKEFHVIATDIMMPDMDGVSLLKILRNMFLTTEFILLTGYSSEEMATRCFKNGAFGYLSKPFKTDEFLAMVREAAAHCLRKKRMILRSAPKC